MTKTFHLIYNKKFNGGNKEKCIATLFEKNCKEKGITFAGYDISELGTSFTFSDLPTLGTDDLIYRLTTGKKARTVERIMLNKSCTSFYTDWQSVNSARIASWFTHIKYGLPVVPSYPGVPASANELKTVVEQLGSFPIIIKVTGGSLGVGVMRIDSMKSLQSILDYLEAKEATVMLRKYIPHDYYVRAVVVGDTVVASNSTYVLEGEFRTNVSTDQKQKREEHELKPELQEQVVQAVRTLGIETGGVDLLFDEAGKAYIAEVNFPNDFSTAQKVTGVDITEKMIEYLLNKSENKTITDE
jgi:RimK family alpha-L-glutamate ligase